jgi:DNA (cytosine-5)-methyltransferase 1
MEKKIKLGSLFSGSAGFELAGALHGIEPVWSSEIEPFCIRVEALRFPKCKQLGSVTDIHGDQIEPVDIITFGSPCQDLSVAGKQAGIHDGERSNLFFEAIRIIKEMRHATANKYPRFAVWENVPGAFSSNKGEDFRAVLNAFCTVCDDTADVPRPADGVWQSAGCVLGDSYSIAWKIYDAQYWAVPQRRKRIYLISDFATERSGEILFKPDSMCWDYQTGREARERAAGYVAGSFDGSDWQCWWPRND